MFGRQIQNKLPNIGIAENINKEIDEEIRKSQNEKYEKCTKRFNVSTKAKPSNINVGDKVLLKRDDKGDKFDSKFYKTVYDVITVKGNMIIIKDNRGNELARNVVNLKKLELKNYPKRNRNQLERD